MPEAVLQRGVRADQAAPGAGLGPAIFRDLAEVCGGSIALGNPPHGIYQGLIIAPIADRRRPARSARRRDRQSRVGSARGLSAGAPHDHDRAADRAGQGDRRRQRRRIPDARFLRRVIETLNDGRLLAYSADHGEKLLEIDTGVGSGVGPPITYRIGGRQYISLVGGIGRQASLLPGSPFAVADTPPPKLLTYAVDAASTDRATPR